MKLTIFKHLLIAGSCLLLAAGCSKAPSTVGSAKSTFKVALLTTGDINDGGWNQLAYDSLQQLKKDMGVQTANQVTAKTADQLPAMRDFADQKYHIIFCHGFEYGERVKSIAPNYPDTKFVVVAGNVKQDPNVATMIPKLEDATYLLGMAAGGLTKSNVVGLLGGMRIPVIQSTFDAFAQGAKAVNPKVKVLTNYVGNFDDQNAAKEATRGMIAQGADVLFHNADQAGKGMFDAAQESKNVLVFGSNSNQNDLAPDVCLASAVINLPRAFEEETKAVQEGKFKADFVELNLANGDIGVDWNPALKNKVPADLMKKIDAAAAEIKSGKLKIKRNVE
jgi:basic membrane lipoprotein Med (substrate-binding protein (PBP1-ABC) superfamily)